MNSFYDDMELCANCIYMNSIGIRDFCVRYPPIKKAKFPIVDPYYTCCGEFKRKVRGHDK